MTPINRIEFIQVLESVEPGVTKGTSTVEQSNAFCFKNGKVYAYDGEVFCRAITPLPKDMVGAVQGKQLLEALRAIEVDNVEVELTDGNFTIRTKKDRVRVRAEMEVILPYQDIPHAETWTRLPQPFCEGIEMVTECAGRDEEIFLLTCVHITPKFIEANDNFSFGRWRMKTGIDEPILVRSKAIREIAKRGPTKVGMTKDWLHFKNATGMTAAISRFDPADHGGENLERLEAVTESKGKPVKFPKRLISATKLANIFSSEFKDNNILKVYLRSDRVKIISEGVSGDTLHKGKVTWAGPNISFTIGPEMLRQLVEKHPEVEIGSDLIIVHGDRWFFATVARPIKEKEKV